jgi:hypothetical protein
MHRTMVDRPLLSRNRKHRLRPYEEMMGAVTIILDAKGSGPVWPRVHRPATSRDTMFQLRRAVLPPHGVVVLMKAERHMAKTVGMRVQSRSAGRRFFRKGFRQLRPTTIHRPSRIPAGRMSIKRLLQLALRKNSRLLPPRDRSPRPSILQ